MSERTPNEPNETLDTQASRLHRAPSKDEWQGIAFTLEGLGEVEFARLIADLTTEAAFARPLQLRVTEPKAGQAGQITLAFLPQHRPQARAAAQRLKTLMLRHGVQVDSIRVAGE